MISTGYRCIFIKKSTKQVLLPLLPICKNSLLRKFANTNSPSQLYPVKLAYASYESTAGSSSERASVPPIMIMHGLLGSKNNWNSLAKAIHQRTNRKVIATDARNHGDSPHAPEHTYEHMAADVVVLLKDLGIKKAILVGHSMGGRAMMYVALNYPQVVEKLVVVDMSPVRTSPSIMQMTQLFEVMKNIKLEENVSLSKARKLTDQQLSAVISSVALRQFILTNLVEAEAGKYKWRINLPVLEQHFAKYIASFPDPNSKVYPGPTLFIGGAESDYIKKDDHDGIKRIFPTARFEYIPGASHWVHSDKPKEFIDIITAFINQT